MWPHQVVFLFIIISARHRSSRQSPPARAVQLQEPEAAAHQRHRARRQAFLHEIFKSTHLEIVWTSTNNLTSLSKKRHTPQQGPGD
jgi:hypothetical protein